MKIVLHKIIKNAVRLRVRYLSNRNFLIVASVLVGIVVGLVAALLKGFVHIIQGQLKFVLERPEYNFLFYLLPLIGILLTVIFVHHKVY